MSDVPITDAGTDFRTWWRPNLERLACDLTAEVLRLRAERQRIAAACGIPDPAEACRVILAIVEGKEAV